MCGLDCFRRRPYGVRDNAPRFVPERIAYSFLFVSLPSLCIGTTSLRLLPSQKDVQDNVAALGAHCVFVFRLSLKKNSKRNECIF
jgi:hypothetical protein